MVTTYGALMRRTAQALEAEEGPNAAYTAHALMSYLTGKAAVNSSKIQRGSVCGPDGERPWPLRTTICIWTSGAG